VVVAGARAGRILGPVSRLVLLLRGINVGRAKRIGMADLRELLTEAGYGDVRTHLQSGNVVLSCDQPAASVARDVHDRIKERFGFDVAVIARTAAELTAVVEAAPLADVATDPARHMVAFLSAEPDAAAVRELEATDFAAEQIVAAERELYLWCPDGLQNSALVKALTAERLGVEVTVRNWNTVVKVLKMAVDA